MFKDTLLSIQHFFAMYAGAIAVPIIVGNALSLSSTDITHLISADLITSGIATILYLVKFKYIGVGMPVVLGASFNSVGAFIAIGSSSGLPTVYGAIIMSGLFIILIAPLLSKIGTIFPKVVLGVIVTMIGLSLLPIAFAQLGGNINAENYGSGLNLLLALLTLAFIFLWHNFSKGFLKSIGLLIAIVLFSIIGNLFFPQGKMVPPIHSQWFSFPTAFHFGAPVLDGVAIVTMIIIMIITSLESLGGLFTLFHICDKNLTRKEMSNGFRSEGIATVLGGVFNAFTYSNFAQNIALVALTGVKRLRVIGILSCILIILGFIPKIASLSLLIPPAVLGAVLLLIFGIIVANGLRMLVSTDLKNDLNIWTIALSLGMGVGTITHPQLLGKNFPLLQPFLSNPIIMASLVGMIVYSIMSYTIKLRS